MFVCQLFNNRFVFLICSRLIAGCLIHCDCLRLLMLTLARVSYCSCLHVYYIYMYTHIVYAIYTYTHISLLVSVGMPRDCFFAWFGLHCKVYAGISHQWGASVVGTCSWEGAVGQYLRGDEMAADPSPMKLGLRHSLDFCFECFCTLACWLPDTLCLHLRFCCLTCCAQLAVCLVVACCHKATCLFPSSLGQQKPQPW